MVSLSNHVAISMRLNTRQRTAVATATRLLRYARNDKATITIATTTAGSVLANPEPGIRCAIRRYTRPNVQS